jgi:hypothetical protein
MHKTEKTAKESRMNFMYSHLCDTTLVFPGLAVKVKRAQIILVSPPPLFALLFSSGQPGLKVAKPEISAK